jgi:outer membrane biosynthesis protein TonB
MAILHHKEEKIQVVLGRLPKTYTHEQFVEMFIKLYSKDWGKIKAAYIKQSQDKEPGTVINMPKPDLYLQQILTTYLATNQPKAEPKIEEKTVKPKAVAKKKEIVEVEKEPVKKTKTVAKDKVTEEAVAPKKKTPAKKKVEEEIKTPAKAKKAVSKEK